MASEEQTFIMVKPDGVQRGLIAEVISRYEKRGYKMVAMKFCKPPTSLFEEHYKEHVGKGFFKPLIEYITSGPVCAMVWEGKDVVNQGRKINGATNPLKAEMGTIRGDFALDMGRNIVHGSDSVESAKREISLWFKKEEMVSWSMENYKWIIEKK